jgi:hypothetical protein
MGGGGSRVCNLLNLVLYPKHVYFASLMLTAEYWGLGVRTVHAPEQDHNYNLDRIALNYPCLISRLRVVSHNRTKCRENEIREHNYFFSCLCRSQRTFRTLSGDRNPHEGRGAPSTFLSVDGGRFWVYSSSTS